MKYRENTMRKTFFLTAFLFLLVWTFSILDEKGRLKSEEKSQLVLNEAVVANQTVSEQVAEIDRQIQELERIKRGFDAKVLRHEDYAERLQFQDRSYLEAKRHIELADENREKSKRTQDEIDRLKAERKRLLAEPSL